MWKCEGAVPREVVLYVFPKVCWVREQKDIVSIAGAYGIVVEVVDNDGCTVCREVDV